MLNNEELINKDLIDFWNNTIQLTKEEIEKDYSKDEIDYKKLAPSEKLLIEISKLGKCKKVLDYGCGNGWASIIACKSGCSEVISVDIGNNIIETTKFYSKIYGTEGKTNAFQIDENWLSYEKENTYDGLICSNVIDVVPLKTSIEIIKGINRVTVKGARIVIGMNFYLSKEKAQERGIELIDDKYLFVNNVLRLTSLKDEEWIELFSQYFIVEKLDYFAWPNEKNETRRLFVLRKK